jgi:hypothetical protein
MSADKHRSLARRIAWLRWCSARDENGKLSAAARITNQKGHAHITEDLLRLETDGHVIRGRALIGFGRRGFATTFAASPAGLVFLEETLRRRGDAFGPITLVRDTQSDRPTKTERAQRRETPMDQRLKREAIKKRHAAFRANLELWARRKRDPNASAEAT